MSLRRWDSEAEVLGGGLMYLRMREVVGDERAVEGLVRGYWEEVRRRVGEMGGERGERARGRVEGWAWERFERQVECAVVDWWRFMAGWGVWGNGWVGEERVRGIVERWEEGGWE